MWMSFLPGKRFWFQRVFLTLCFTDIFRILALDSAGREPWPQGQERTVERSSRLLCRIHELWEAVTCPKQGVPFPLELSSLSKVAAAKPACVSFNAPDQWSGLSSCAIFPISEFLSLPEGQWWELFPRHGIGTQLTEVVSREFLIFLGTGRSTVSVPWKLKMWVEEETRIAFHSLTYFETGFYTMKWRFEVDVAAGQRNSPFTPERWRPSAGAAADIVIWCCLVGEFSPSSVTLCLFLVPPFLLGCGNMRKPRTLPSNSPRDRRAQGVVSTSCRRGLCMM